MKLNYRQQKWKVLIVAKCNVNSTVASGDANNFRVLIVAKCNVNTTFLRSLLPLFWVLIVAKCNVNPHLQCSHL